MSNTIKMPTRRLVTRRQALAMTGAAAAAPFILRAGRAIAATELVLVNWGGDAIPNFDNAFAKPFEKETGMKVTIDGTGPTDGKIKAMVESKNVTWNVCDADGFTSENLGSKGLLEEIDYSIVDRNKVRPGHAFQYGCCSYIYSYVITYNSSKLKQAPTTLADFWDLEKFPGKRTFWKYMSGALEAALVADGVPVDKLYPLDVDRALKKLEEIKDHIILWESGADSQRFLREGEVSMGLIWHTRSTLLERDTKGEVKWSFNQGLACPSSWVVPKGAKNVKETMQFIAFMQKPELQVELLKSMSNGPANPAGSAMAPADLAKIDPGNEANWKIQIPMDVQWYGKNYNDVLNDYLDFFAS
ncbi:MAG: ABC transporter substrate-binding protein [Rhodospirillaceae bacterium]|nr:MAG: ABC transporter substrate-binding protein [Rhodospirillaceae bacterium]